MFTECGNNSYEVRVGRALHEHNVVSIYNISLNMCKEECEAAYWCQSFDFKNMTVCHLSNKSANDPQMLLKRLFGFTYFHVCFNREYFSWRCCLIWIKEWTRAVALSCRHLWKTLNSACIVLFVGSSDKACDWNVYVGYFIWTTEL